MYELPVGSLRRYELHFSHHDVLHKDVILAGVTYNIEIYNTVNMTLEADSSIIKMTVSSALEC